MSLIPIALESIVPYRYLTFTLPCSQQAYPLQFAVLDYPVDDIDVPGGTLTAAMLVPHGRESDWIFSAFSGHLQLLVSVQSDCPVSRLILVSNAVSYGCPAMDFESTIHSSPSTTIQQNLAPLLIQLTPKSEFSGGVGEVLEVPILIYEDDVKRSSILEICEGPQTGEMLIENVELEIDGVKEYRRRLRFKRMPNLVQTQIRLHPRSNPSLATLDKVEFELDMEVLVQPYLIPMVTGLWLMRQFLDSLLLGGIRPKALCLGVGGGSLVGFLASKLCFEVTGVDEDEVVLKVAKKHFGLESNELIHLYAEDGLQHIKNLAQNTDTKSEFEVIMVDLDSSDPTSGPYVAPPVEFIRRSFLLATRDILHQNGVLIINTVPIRKHSHEMFIRLLQEIFMEVYEIDVGNEENVVLIAIKSEVGCDPSSDDGIIWNALKMIVPKSCLDAMRKIPKNFQ